MVDAEAAGEAGVGGAAGGARRAALPAVPSPIYCLARPEVLVRKPSF